MESQQQTLAQRNAHPADQYIHRRTDGSHTYVIRLPEDSSDSELPDVISTSKLLEKYFRPFDAETISRHVARLCYTRPGHRYEGMSAERIREKWTTHGDQSRDLGHLLHRAIELYFDPAAGEDTDELKAIRDTVEFAQFRQFYDDFTGAREVTEDPAIPYRTEWIVYDRSARVAGTLDMLFYNPSDDTYTLVDWKRIKRLDRTAREKGLGPLHQHPSCNLSKYTLQLNTYRYILENVYGLKVRDAFLVCMHPNRPRHHVEPIPKEPMTGHIVTRIFGSLRNQHVLRWALKQDQKQNSSRDSPPNDALGSSTICSPTKTDGPDITKRVRRDSGDTGEVHQPYIITTSKGQGS